MPNFKLMVAAKPTRLELERKQYEPKFNGIDATARPDGNLCVFRYVCRVSKNKFVMKPRHSFYILYSNSFTAKIFLFYVVLYAFLAAFFAAMLMVFFQTLDLYQPRWQNANGPIGTNPGIKY
jgi:hypothetical protein